MGLRKPQGAEYGSWIDVREPRCVFASGVSGSSEMLSFETRSIPYMRSATARPRHVSCHRSETCDRFECVGRPRTGSLYEIRCVQPCWGRSRRRRADRIHEPTSKPRRESNLAISRTRPDPVVRRSMHCIFWTGVSMIPNEPRFECGIEEFRNCGWKPVAFEPKFEDCRNRQRAGRSRIACLAPIAFRPRRGALQGIDRRWK